jgi:ribosomal protein S15P/S13E
MLLGVFLNVLRERSLVTLTKLTQAQAARAARVSRTSIWRAVREGRLSAERLDDGSLRIDASELLRVYPRADLDRARRGGDGVTRTGTSDAQRALKGRIDGELRALTEHLDELKRDKERLVRELEAAAAERRQLLSMLEAKDRLLEDKRERKRWRWFRARGAP